MIPEGERPIRIVTAENIKKYFELSDYSSVTKFSNDVGLDSIRIKKLMDGEIGCSLEKLQRIAAALKVKTIDLIEDWSEE